MLCVAVVSAGCGGKPRQFGARTYNKKIMWDTNTQALLRSLAYVFAPHIWKLCAVVISHVFGAAVAGQGKVVSICCISAYPFQFLKQLYQFLFVLAQ